MNTFFISNVVENTWMACAGWTLIHFVWQGALIGLVTAFLLLMLRRNSSQARYVAACGGLALVALAPLVTFIFLIANSTTPNDYAGESTESSLVEQADNSAIELVAETRPGVSQEQSTTQRLPATGILAHGEQNVIDQESNRYAGKAATPSLTSAEGSRDDSTLPGFSWLVKFESYTRPFLPLIVVVWMCGVFIGSARLTCSITRVFNLTRKQLHPVDRQVNQLLLTVSKRMNIKRSIKLFESKLVEVPTVVGHLQPVILLPATTLTGLSSDQLRAVLAHELAHIKRTDYLVNILQMLVENLLFYHPAIWWISKQIRIERENCCDDLAVEHFQDRRVYAAALFQLEQSITKDSTGLAMQASGGSLLARIQRLTGQRTTGYSASALFAASASFLIVAITLCCMIVNQTLAADAHSGQVFSNESSQPQQEQDKSAVEGKDKPAQEATEQSGIEIIVVDESGEPIKDAFIHAGVWSDDRTFAPNQQEYTDETGNARIKLPSEFNILRIWVRAKGRVPLFANWEEDEIKSGTKPPQKYKFTLVEGTTIGGFVKDKRGNPIVGARVDVQGSRSSDAGKRTRLNTYLAYGEAEGTVDGGAATTDENGYWEIDNAPTDPTAKFTVRLRHKEFIDDEYQDTYQQLQAVDTEDFRNKTATLVMHRGAVVTGTITDTDGNPVSSAVVVWGDSPYGQHGSQEVRSEEDGSYRSAILKPGKTRITVVAPNFSPQTKIVEAEAMMDPVDFQLKPGKHLIVKFVDDDGNPIPNVYVGIERWRRSSALYNHRHPNVLDTQIPIRADEGGVYQWTWAPEDEVTYNVGKPGFVYQRDLKLTANGEVHEVVLNRPMKIAGDVFDASSGERIKEFRVVPLIHLRPEIDPESSHERRDKTAEGKSGRFRIELDRGDVSYRIRIEAEGYKTAVSDLYKFGDIVPRLKFELEKQAWLNGRVLDTTGNPLADAKIHVASASHTLMLHDFSPERMSEGQKATTDEQGNFQLPVTDHPFTLLVANNEGYSEIVCRPGETIGDIRLQKWATLEGVLTRNGKPMPGIRIGCQGVRYQYGRFSHIQRMATATTDKNGRYNFNRVPPIQLEVHTLDHVHEELSFGINTPVQPKPGENVVVNFGDGIQVTGQIQVSNLPPGVKQIEMSRGKILVIEPPPFEMPESLKKVFDWRKGWRDHDALLNQMDVQAYLYVQNSLNHFRFHSDSDGKFSFYVPKPGEYELSLKCYVNKKRITGDAPLAETTLRFTVDNEATTSGKHDLGNLNLKAFPGLRVGDEVPDFKIHMGPDRKPKRRVLGAKPDKLQGEAITLASTRGKFVLLDFWLPWEKHDEDRQMLVELTDRHRESDRLQALSIEHHPGGSGYSTRAPESGHPIWTNGVLPVAEANELNQEAWHLDLAALQSHRPGWKTTLPR